MNESTHARRDVNRKNNYLSRVSTTFTRKRQPIINWPTGQSVNITVKSVYSCGTETECKESSTCRLNTNCNNMFLNHHHVIVLY